MHVRMFVLYVLDADIWVKKTLIFNENVQRNQKKAESKFHSLN